MSRFAGMLGWAGLSACAPEALPPDFGGDALWHPVDLDNATDRNEPTDPIPTADQQPAGPITLTLASASAGLANVVAGGNSHGVGVAFTDLDGDDWADIVVISGVSNVTGERFDSQMLRNRGDGTFENVTEASGLGAILNGRDGYSVAAGDLDADGDIDLYVGAQPTDVWLRNRGDGTFEDATMQAGAGGPPSEPALVSSGSSKIVSLGDLDGDGDLDIVSASSTLPRPGAYMLRNEGDGTFSSITEQSGVEIDPTGNPCAVMWTDIDNDTDPDLWIWNDRGGRVLLRNDGGTLHNITDEAGLDAVTITHPMGIDGADIDHDGDLDYYVSNIGNNPLLRNNGDQTFVDITRLAGTEGQYGWGLGFEDFNADSWPDVFVAQEDDRPELVFEHRGEIPPVFDELQIAHPPVLNGDAAHNVAVAFADYDHDGRTDVLTARTDGSAIALYRNETDLGTHGTLDIVVTPPPSEVPGGAVGARVAVATGELIQFRDISGGSSRASQNEVGVRFGLGQFRGADWVAVQWPDGRQTVVRNVGAGQRLHLP